MECLQIANFLQSICLFFSDQRHPIQRSYFTQWPNINHWAFQWKMIFNPDLTKQAQEVIFIRKTKKLLHSCLQFNDTLKEQLSQRHLWLTLDVKVNFVDHIKNVTQKISKILSLLRRFQPILPRSSLLTTYKTFIRSQLDFADVKACNSSFHEKLESVQTGIAYLAITGAIRGKTIPKARVRIPKIETLVQKTLSLL